MTKAAKHFGKQLQHFWGAVDTRAYMTALLEAQGKTSNFDKLFATKAGYNGGTWAHPKLARLLRTLARAGDTAGTRPDPLRKPGEAPLRHDYFMAKVPKVLGEGVREFSDTYIHPQNGQRYPCYRFPKREACLMAMSYSYEMQARVFDCMTALKEQQRARAAQLREPR